jgi:oxygen-dependent protoporphyrinogen oxidase
MAKVIIVGGGLAGLTAAFRLCGDAEVEVLEGAPSPGGQIRTERSAGFAIERGAEGFVFRSEAVPALAADLGMPDELMGQSVMRSYGFGDDGLRVLAPGEAAASLGFQVPKADLGKGIRTFRRGMASLTRALEDTLRGRARITCGAIATSIEPSSQGACVTLDDGTRHDAELVIAATHARGAAALLAPHFGDAVVGLSQAPTLSSVTVELAFERAQVDHALDGTGFVVAAEHQRDGLSACTFTSAKFADRSPPGKVSLRLFFRPSPEQLHELDDDAWAERALRGVRRIVQVHGQPLRAWVSRWPDALPVFSDRHTAAVAEAEAALASSPIVLAGSAFHGAGIDAAVRSGEAAAFAARSRGLSS